MGGAAFISGVAFEMALIALFVGFPAGCISLQLTFPALDLDYFIGTNFGRDFFASTL